MGQLLSTLAGVAIAIGISAMVFIGVNKWFDLAPRRFEWFAAVLGVLVGIGLGAYSSTLYVGGPLLLLAWAVPLGAVGWALGRRFPPSLKRREAISRKSRPVIFLGPALLFLTVALVIPTIRTAYLSFRNKDGSEFRGLENYRWAASSKDVVSFAGGSNIFTSRLFIVGVVLLVVAVVVTVVNGQRRQTGADFSGAGPVLTIAAGVTAVLLAVFTTLRGLLWNNLLWIIAVPTLATALGLTIAVLADRTRGEKIAKSLVFMPMAISFVGASVIWRFVYAYRAPGEEQFGLLNAATVAFGASPRLWLQDAPWNNLFLIAVMIWIQTGFAMVVLSAAIKAVPTELIEAARIDGATDSQVFWRVTLPSIRTTVGVVVTTIIILVLKVYDIVKVMTGGNFGTNVVAKKMFDQAFVFSEYGRGSTLATLLLVAVLPMMVLTVRRVRREAM